MSCWNISAAPTLTAAIMPSENALPKSYSQPRKRETRPSQVFQKVARSAAADGEKKKSA